VFKSEKIGWYWQWFIAYDCSGGFYNYVITCNHCVSFTADVHFTSSVTSLITCPHCVSFTVALVICKLKRILKGFTSLAAQRVFFDDANNATCKSRVGFNGLPYSVTFPCCRYERTIFGFACERTRGAWIHACDTTVQYRFVSHCCDVILLCIVSQISNKYLSGKVGQTQC